MAVVNGIEGAAEDGHSPDHAAHLRHFRPGHAQALQSEPENMRALDLDNGQGRTARQGLTHHLPAMQSAAALATACWRDSPDLSSAKAWAAGMLARTAGKASTSLQLPGQGKNDHRHGACRFPQAANAAHRRSGLPCQGQLDRRKLSKRALSATAARSVSRSRVESLP
jgi:hypothetical protein